MKKSAFTLIELLVVIVIIAVLAGIALPVFGKVAEKGHATNDMNNLRQIGVGTIAYLTDHDDQIFNNNDKWAQLLNTDPASTQPGKYVPAWKTFRSPFDKRGDGLTPPAVSYGINTNILTQPGANGWDGNVAKMDAPSQLIYMAPALSAAIKTAGSAAFTGTATTNVPLNPATVAPFEGTHFNYKQINALYMDMHVATLKFGPATSTEAFCNTNIAAGTPGQQRWLPKGP